MAGVAVEASASLVATVEANMSSLIQFSNLEVSLKALLDLVQMQGRTLAKQETKLQEVDVLRSQNERMDTRITALEASLAERDAKIQSLESENDAHKQNLETVRLEMKQISHAIEGKADEAIVLALSHRVSGLEGQTKELTERVSKLESEFQHLSEIKDFVDKEMVGRLRHLESLIEAKADHERIMNEIHGLGLKRKAIEDQLSGFGTRLDKQQALCQTLSTDLLNKADRADLRGFERVLDTKASISDLDKVRQSIKFVDNIAKMQGLIELKADIIDLRALEALLENHTKVQEEQKRAITEHASQLIKLAEALRDCANVSAVERLNKMLRTLEERGAGLDKEGLLELMARLENKADKDMLLRLEEFISQFFTEENGLVVAKVQYKCLTCDRTAVNMRSQPPRQDQDSNIGTPAQISGQPVPPPYVYDDFSTHGKQYQLFGSDGHVYKARQPDAEVHLIDSYAGALQTEATLSSMAAHTTTTTTTTTTAANSVDVPSGPIHISRPSKLFSKRPSSARPASASSSRAPVPLNLSQAQGPPSSSSTGMARSKRPQSAPLRRDFK